VVTFGAPDYGLGSDVVIPGSQFTVHLSITELPVDSDGDGLNDNVETGTTHTNPLDPDTDHDGLNDGAEVNTYHTNPLDPDTDHDGLSDGAEVNTYHTNPLDPDTDHDGLPDGIEVSSGLDPLDSDTDNDGILDGADPDWIQNVVAALPVSAFRDSGGGQQTAVMSALEAVERDIAAGRKAHALEQVQQLRIRVDGCGAIADGNDWVTDCTTQLVLRGYVDLLVANVSH
jgi:hypothetical protein